jgi:hypothetical protein
MTRLPREHDSRARITAHATGRHAPACPLQKLGGWRTAAMVRRYAHLKGAHLSSHVDAFGTRVGVGSARLRLAARKEGAAVAAALVTI